MSAKMFGMAVEAVYGSTHENKSYVIVCKSFPESQRITEIIYRMLPKDSFVLKKPKGTFCLNNGNIIKVAVRKNADEEFCVPYNQSEYDYIGRRLTDEESVRMI